MQRIWIDIRSHRLASTLFIAWWLVLTLINFIGSRGTQGSTEQIHFMLPVIAGGMICWWRKETREKITGGTVAGAVVLFADVMLLLLREAIVPWFRGKALCSVLREAADVEVLVFAAIAVVIGAALGFAGASVAAGLAYLAYRSENATPDLHPSVESARTFRSEPADDTPPTGAGRILPRGAVLIAVGLVLVVAATLAPDVFGRYGPPFASKVNALVALILLAPVPRWSADAGKALLIVAGLVTVLLASFLLVGGGFTWAHGVGRTAIVLVVCAAAQLAAGVLVFRAAFPRPPVHYAA